MTPAPSGSAYSLSTSTSGPHRTIPGARMKTARKNFPSSSSSSLSSVAAAGAGASLAIVIVAVLLPPHDDEADETAAFVRADGAGSLVSKLCTCDPKKFLATVTSSVPSSACPPSFAPHASFARNISPAHVPQIGFPLAAKLLSPSSSPFVAASFAMVVLSPPGITTPLHDSSSCAFRTSMTSTSMPLTRRRALICSEKLP